MLRGLLLSLLSAACYGTSPIIYKFGFRAGIAPLDLLQYRFILATLFIFLYMLATNPSELKAGSRTLCKAAFSGVVLYCLQSYFFLMALRTIPAATTSLILYLYPVAVTLASLFCFKLRLTRAIVLSLGIISLGSLLVSLDAFQRSLDLAGVLYACGAMIVFSAYMVANQTFMARENPMTFTLYVLAFVAATFMAAGHPLAMADYDGRQILICVLAGLVPTALAVPLLYKAIGKIGSAYVSIFSTFEPVTTLCLAWLILGEDISLAQIAGMVLIITGIALPNLSLLKLRRAVAPRAAESADA